MDQLASICAEGTYAHDRMVSINSATTLRVISFLPHDHTDRPIVLFIAGWITQISAWESVLREMTRDHIVHYIETREKKSSQVNSPAEFGIEAIGSDLEPLIAQLIPANASYVVFGSSLGATVIVDTYQRLTHKPTALALVGPNAVFRVPLIWKVIIALFYPPMYSLIKPPVKWYLKHFRLNVQSDPEQYRKYCAAIDSADPRKLKKAVTALAQYAIWDRLPTVDCPTLLIGASKDSLHEPELLKKIASQMPTAALVDLETNARTHSPEVVQHVRTFLSGISPTSLQR